MKRENLLAILFLAITAGILYLFYRLLLPFLVPICWAGVFVIILYPLYGRVLQRVKRPVIAALLMTLLVVLLILGPVGYLFVELVQQATAAVQRLNELHQSGQLSRILALDVPWLAGLKERLSAVLDLSKLNLESLAQEGLQKLSGIVLAQTSWLIGNATVVILDFTIMIFTTYYFFKDGPRVVERLRSILPLEPDQTERALAKMREVIEATIVSGVMVALLQGFLGGVLFAIVGIPSAVFWGSVMAFLSIIPFVGAFIVYIPAGIILIVTGSTVKGIVVLLIGTVLVSQVDNFLRPYLMAGRTSMHPLILFFAVAGGISMFGLFGVVAGPLIAAAFVLILTIVELRLQQNSNADAT